MDPTNRAITNNYCICRHLKLEIVLAIPASNDEYFYICMDLNLPFFTFKALA